MSKYHVTADGTPKLCTAQLRPCPLGGEHFETKQAAKLHAEAKLKEAFSEVPASARNTIDVVCEFGVVQLKDGDLSDPKARMTLVNGLCGDVAKSIHKRTGGEPFFVTYDGLSEPELLEKFAVNSEDLLNVTTHVMIESPTRKGYYLDAYGQKSLDEIREFYGDEINMVRGSKEMLDFYATGKNDLDSFASSALELDQKNQNYSYFDYGS